jgi:hypothetical protein
VIEEMETHQNIAVGIQANNAKINETVILSAVLLTVVVSFFFGFIMGEDSIGGARFDFDYFHWPIIKRFSTMSWSAAAADYPSATNPLLYILASLSPFHNDQRTYRGMSFAIALLTWPLLTWAYHRRYSNNGIDWLWALFGASTILISPSFRSSAFWGTTDYLPFVFCAGTSLLLSRIQDSEDHESRPIGLFFLIAVAVVSSSAFYDRQFYAFLPAFAAYVLITRTGTSSFVVLGVFFIAALPEVFLIYLWKGINPPTFHGQFHPAMTNVLTVGAIIGLLSTPLIIGCIRRSVADVLPEWWGAWSNVIAFAGLFIFILALSGTSWPEAGGGIIVKAGLGMGALGTPFILTVSYFGLLAATIFSMGSATNALLAGAFVLPFFLAFPAYQHYLEPSLAIAMFLFADTRTARALFNKRVLKYNFAFTVIILVIGIAHYDVFINFPDIK